LFPDQICLIQAGWPELVVPRPGRPDSDRLARTSHSRTNLPDPRRDLAVSGQNGRIPMDLYGEWGRRVGWIRLLPIGEGSSEGHYRKEHHLEGNALMVSVLTPLLMVHSRCDTSQQHTC
jgi:hypothetical protein